MRRYLIRANRGNAHTRISQFDAFGIEPRLPIDRLGDSDDKSVLEYSRRRGWWGLPRLMATCRVWRDGIGTLALILMMLVVLVLMMTVQDMNAVNVYWMGALLVIGVVGIFLIGRRV